MIAKYVQGRTGYVMIPMKAGVWRIIVNMFLVLYCIVDPSMVICVHASTQVTLERNGTIE